MRQRSPNSKPLGGARADFSGGALPRFLMSTATMIQDEGISDRLICGIAEPIHHQSDTAASELRIWLLEIGKLKPLRNCRAVTP